MKKMQETFVLEFNKNPRIGLDYLAKILGHDMNEDEKVEIISHCLLITNGISKITLGKYFASGEEIN